MKERKPYEDDDGRTIAKMDVDGMPWYLERARRDQDPDKQPLELSKAERWAMLKGVLAAAMLIVLIFVVGFALFILYGAWQALTA